MRVVVVARVRHAGRWRPAGAAATFLLAAVAGVAGNQLTGHLTSAQFGDHNRQVNFFGTDSDPDRHA